MQTRRVPRFPGSRLERADFESATLVGADLSGAKLKGSDFRNADLRAFQVYDRSGKSNFRTQIPTSLAGADCADCDFRGTDLSGVNLSSTRLLGAKFDLSTVLPFSHEQARRYGMVFSGPTGPLETTNKEFGSGGVFDQIPRIPKYDYQCGPPTGNLRDRPGRRQDLRIEIPDHTAVPK